MTREIRVRDGTELKCREHRWRAIGFDLSTRRITERCARCGKVETKAIDKPPAHTAVLESPANR